MIKGIVRRRLTRAPLRGVAVLLAGGALLVTAAVAIAAHPKKHAHFTGATVESPINGFKAPVTFAVSANGTTLTGFTYSTLGCVGAGGFQPGVDYYTKPGSVMKVGTVKVSRSGHFSAVGAVWVHTEFGVTTRTTSKVSGSFTSAKSASGKVSFSQQLSGKFTTSCGPSSIGFTARAH